MSDVKKFALEVKWRIENIQSWLQERDDPLYSPQFLAETLANTRWKLCLSTNWQLSEKYVSLTLQRDIEDDGPKLIDLNCELSLLKCDGSPLKSKSRTKKFALKTISLELNVKQAEILVEKKEVYLPEGVLTVCCKLWNTWPTVSKQGQCSVLRSVIGTKHLKLSATVNNFCLSSYAVVNFLSPSTDINLISLDVYVNPHEFDENRHEFVFKKKYIECKSFNWYSLKLFGLDISGRSKEFDEIFNLMNRVPIADRANWAYFCSKNFPNNTLTLQLEVSYHPGVISESSIEFKSFENLPCKATDLEVVEVCGSKMAHFSISDDLASTDPFIQEGQSSEEDKHLDAAGKKCLPSTALKEDMTSLYNDRLFCDTKLQTDTETFLAHRCILSARSPVFKKMFTTDMKEKAGECINVPDISSDTLRRMLQFIYTDCTGDLEMQSAKDLYIASDKYGIACLKRCCSSFMKENLCSSNVCDVLVLADMHQDKDLESAAQEYVLTNDEEVFYSDEWKLFMKNFGGLAAQVMYLKFTKK